MEKKNCLVFEKFREKCKENKKNKENKEIQSKGKQKINLDYVWFPETLRLCLVSKKFEGKCKEKKIQKKEKVKENKK